MAKAANRPVKSTTATASVEAICIALGSVPSSRKGVTVSRPGLRPVFGSKALDTRLSRSLVLIATRQGLAHSAAHFSTVGQS